MHTKLKNEDQRGPVQFAKSAMADLIVFADTTSKVKYLTLCWSNERQVYRSSHLSGNISMDWFAFTCFAIRFLRNFIALIT